MRAQDIHPDEEVPGHRVGVANYAAPKWPTSLLGHSAALLPLNKRSIEIDRQSSLMQYATEVNARHQWQLT
jgi:hypothetical protein